MFGFWSILFVLEYYCLLLFFSVSLSFFFFFKVIIFLALVSFSLKKYGSSTNYI